LSVIDNSNLGTLWNRILGLFSARKINNKSLAKDITINDEDIPSTAVNGETTVEGALGNIADKLSNQSQQIDDSQPVIVTVTVNANSVSMSAADQAKLTDDMIKIWHYGDTSKLTKRLEITPGNGTVSFNDARATSQIDLTIAFLRTSI